MQKLMFVSIFITTRSLMMQCDRMWSDAPPITAWQLTLTHTHHQGFTVDLPSTPSLEHQTSVSAWRRRGRQHDHVKAGGGEAAPRATSLIVGLQQHKRSTEKQQQLKLAAAIDPIDPADLLLEPGPRIRLQNPDEGPEQAESSSSQPAWVLPGERVLVLTCCPQLFQRDAGSISSSQPR